MDGVINMTSAAELVTWSDLEAARDAVAEGEIFAKGVNVTDGTYEVRLRRHGRDALAEVSTDDGVTWAPVDSVDGDGVIDIRDVDTEVAYFPAV